MSNAIAELKEIPSIQDEISAFKDALQKDEVYQRLLSDSHSVGDVLRYDIQDTGYAGVYWLNSAVARLWRFWIISAYGRDAFTLVPTKDVMPYYIGTHLEGTTCSVDVSDLTGEFGDRIYGKFRGGNDCIGSDGNTLLYDLESANFKFTREPVAKAKHLGNANLKNPHTIVEIPKSRNFLDAVTEFLTSQIPDKFMEEYVRTKGEVAVRFNTIYTGDNELRLTVSTIWGRGVLTLWESNTLPDRLMISTSEADEVLKRFIQAIHNNPAMFKGCREYEGLTLKDLEKLHWTYLVTL